MGKISSYAAASTPILTDKLIGTSTDNNDQTKNFTIADILGLGIVSNYVEVAADYTLTASNSIVNFISGSFTATLPTAIGIIGRQFTIKNTGVGTITLDAFSTQTIDGVLTQSILANESLTVVSTNTNWILI